ncbi:UNVERIFIED_CONTAM: hypothetical protein PYX00_000216 [Menopon gallinae]|uniref:Uncharacterized protein n=1 Tax=Menopon gallinae TaxID=328185 RepID=A0AAW2I845_9NEOP
MEYTLKSYKKIPVHIVEDHNEALPVIYRAIGSRHLPLNNNCLVHFDSHPDLLAPKDMNAETVWNKYELFQHLSIENWILPSCYSKQFNNIYWVKPKWSDQIPLGEYKILIGSDDNKIRVDSNLYYFLSDGLYSHKDSMKNVSELNLNVIEMTSDENLEKLNAFLKREKYFVLDVDLDFFSTLNPFSKMFQAGNLYDKLKKLYSFDLPEKIVVDFADLTHEANQKELLQKFSKNRNQQLNELGIVFKHMEDMGSFDDIVEDLSIVKEGPVRDVIKCVKEHYGNDIDWHLLHNAGQTCDVTELPHHVSTESELNVLFGKFESFLKTLEAKPTLITIARSTEDDYCPQDQVSFIQKNVLSILEKIYGDLQVEKTYLGNS